LGVAQLDGLSETIQFAPQFLVNDDLAHDGLPNVTDVLPLRIAGDEGERKHEEVYQRMTAVPQVRPAPKPDSTTNWSRCKRPSASASSRASGIEPADVLP